MLAPFDGNHVGTVNVKNFCKLFLTETSGHPVGWQVLSHDLLQLTFHSPKVYRMLLEGIHTYE